MSTSVTESPSAAKIDAYSTPMTPAPSTIIDRGIRGRRSTVVLSNTVSSSKSMSAGRLGAEPVAMTMTSPDSRSRTCPSTPWTAIVCGVEEPPLAAVDLDRIAGQRAVDELQLPLHDALLAVHQFGDGDGLGDRDLDRVELVVPQAVDEQSRSRAASCSGIVPQLTRIPPTTFSRSTSATRLPARAAWMAARSPPGPPPRTTTSKLITGAPAGDARPVQIPNRCRPVSETEQQRPDGHALRHFTAAGAALNGSMSGTTLTPVVNVKGAVATPLGNVNSTM